MSTTCGPSLDFRALQRVHVTKQMLGNQTRKRILYLDQNFLSLAFRNPPTKWVDEALAHVTELLDLQLLAVPYSSFHIAEADLFKERDALVRFIQKFSRGHHFEPYYRVEETQISKAFQAFLAGQTCRYVKEERDVICPSVHDWDSEYSVSVFTPEAGYERKRAFKQRSVAALLGALDDWQRSSRTFQQDMELEFADAGRILIEEYTKKMAQLWSRDFSALADSPISSGMVETLVFIAQTVKADAKAIPEFFNSQHFRQMPSQQLSARLYAAFKQRLRCNADKLPASEQKRERKYRGLMGDVQHAATYAPYCDAFFTDRDMASLMNDKCVRVEADYACKVFSRSNLGKFNDWLTNLKASMTAEHAEDLTWAYPRYRSNPPS